MTIALLNTRFFAYHGHYSEEQVLGNEFFVDLRVDTNENSSDDQLSSTLNYEHLYQIIKGKMSKPVQLIETLAHNILNEVTAEFKEINHAEISIRKSLVFYGENTTAEITLTFNR